MNIDFHYEGTYCAARDAGFDEETAMIIAQAAEMVDECTKSYLEIHGKYRTSSIVTAETNEDTFWDIMADLSASDSDDLKKLRRIWMPFHFLPGNLTNQYKYEGKTKIGTHTFGARARGAAAGTLSRDEIDMKCMCVHSSPLAKVMIEDTKEQCDADRIRQGSGFKNYSMESLYLIGVRMHVLADTWAHEFFAGTPSLWVNDASEYEKIEAEHIKVNEIGTPHVDNPYVMNYLGHGRAGHYPDYGVLNYSYHPNWMKAGQYLIRTNPFIFKCAYMQMVNAMKYIRKEAADDNFDMGTDSTLKAYFDRLPNSKALKEILETRSADQTRAWHEKRAPELRLFTQEGLDIDAFQEAARRQLSLVCAQLQRNNINIL